MVNSSYRAHNKPYIPVTDLAKSNRIMRGTGLLIKNDEFAEPQIKG